MMKIITIASLVLLLGCSHDSRYPMPRLSGPATEADANAIAQAKVHSKDKWERVDSVARPLDSGWSVFVRPLPGRVAGPYVLVTIDQSGRITDYERAKFDR
jgi:hypothetical protein